MEQRSYIAIDLKSFFASVECVERGLNPLTTNLVVADHSRTEKTICLAVTPSLKACGIPGRPRLFEVVQQVQRINRQRLQQAPGKSFSGSSHQADELQQHPEYSLDYLIASPRMAYYIEYSARIYRIYLRYIAPQDIHVYSIDEVFIDATPYLRNYDMTPRQLAMKMIREVLDETGITATAGIGSNLYLSKVAMDIKAKHIEADEYGVRIAELDETSYRRELWSHRPITDFWRVGRGYAARLEKQGLFTMGDIARCSVGKEHDYFNEDLLYHLFGVNAELLIDHAWGWEPCTIAQIKAYKPEKRSISSAQVLSCPYPADKARLIVREMADQLALELLDQQAVSSQIALMLNYDTENLHDPHISREYTGETVGDYYGRQVPRPAHGSRNLDPPSSSSREIVAAAVELFDSIVDPHLLLRRIGLSANNVLPEDGLTPQTAVEQLELFTDYAFLEQQQNEREQLRKRDRQAQQAILEIKKRFGRNAILRGTNFEEGATTRDRNDQIGGHKS